MTNRACFLAKHFDTACMYRADGRPDRAHLIEKRRLRQAGLTDDEVWDTAVWRYCCRRHHHAFDAKFLHLTESDYPQSVHDFAGSHGFFFAGERMGWRKGAA